MAWLRKDERPPLERALEAAAGLKTGSWAGVETLSILSIEAKGRPESTELYERARQVSVGLASGSWDSVRALSWLVRAGRELGLDPEH